ncbi:hypothetical protein [Xylanibacillus composti]|uniref:Uncharacterized protein n=1 Tax=Xylanibacillus composti TaxID=1572762 RepID=A0A8J4H1R4_9BACL|nr:hypothetical protein [Xylanibacillus composti]GIQ69299.1 hypothetical protein XYCOK13_21230 [Xylanibacillus composti]
MRDKLDLWIRIGLIVLVLLLNMLWPDQDEELPGEPDGWEETDSYESEEGAMAQQ